MRKQKVLIYPLGICLVLLACEGKGGKADKASLPQASGLPVASSKEPAAPVPATPALEATPSAAVTALPQVAPAQPAPKVEAAQRITGEVAAQRRTVLAFRQAGFIEKILAKPGQALATGEALAHLDARDFELRADLAKLRKEQARVALDVAAKELGREQQLAKENASTATALDRAKSAADQARLALRLADLDAVNAQRALDDTKLIAPYDCVVAEQLKDEGENVQVGTGAFVIYDRAAPEIKLSAPERLMGQIKVGSSLTVAVPSAGYTGTAKIIRVVPVISEKSRTFQVIAQPDAPDARIVAGSYAEAVLN